MADQIAMTIEHARLNHQRVECGPGVPGCGPDCEGDGAGKPVAFCPTCHVWPCATSILLGELDRLRAALAEARRLNNEMADCLDWREMAPLGMSLHDVIDAAIGKGPEL